MSLTPQAPVGPAATGFPALTPYRGPGVATPGYTAQVPVGLVPYAAPAPIPKPVLTPYVAPATVAQPTAPAAPAAPSPVLSEVAPEPAGPVAARLSGGVCAQGIQATQDTPSFLDVPCGSQVAFLFIVDSSDLSTEQLQSVLSLVL